MFKCSLKGGSATTIAGPRQPVVDPPPLERASGTRCYETVAGRDNGTRVTCVGLSVKAFFAEGSGPMVLVKVERSQRSEDERR